MLPTQKKSSVENRIIEQFVRENLLGEAIIGKDRDRKQIRDIRPNSYGSHTLENDQGSWKVKKEASFLTVRAKVMRLFTKQATLLESVLKVGWRTEGNI